MVENVTIGEIMQSWRIFNIVTLFCPVILLYYSFKHPRDKKEMSDNLPRLSLFSAVSHTSLRAHRYPSGAAIDIKGLAFSFFAVESAIRMPLYLAAFVSPPSIVPGYATKPDVRCCDT